MVVCVFLCVRSRAGTVGTELAKKGTKNVCERWSANLKWDFPGFFQVKPRLGSVQGWSCLWLDQWMWNLLKKLKRATAYILPWQARWGVQFPEWGCSNLLPSSCAKGKRGRESSETQSSCTCRALKNPHCHFAPYRE